MYVFQVIAFTLMSLCLYSDQTDAGGREGGREGGEGRGRAVDG